MSDQLLAAIDQIVKATVTPAAPNTCFGANCPKAWGWSSPYMNAVISSPPPARPIRYIINTSAAPDHTGGNPKLVAAGTGLRGAQLGGAVGNVEGAPVIAHENVLTRMSAPAGKEPPTPQAAWPTVSYFDDFLKLPAYFNGDPVIVYHAPAANTDGDSIVFFRRSDVISAGDLFSTVSYPVIDVAKGGSVEGVIRGLNNILDLAFAEYRSQGGTWIVPSHGRLSDTADVASYRNMVVMIRDRVQDLIDKGMTLQQVKAARPSLDFDGRYGNTTGEWTTDRFVEAVYASLSKK
jgi:glyoxylase-like metal-dependent hydrolase (beta-lactamase superfamily II)